jgi:hypothetical protein
MNVLTIGPVMIDSQDHDTADKKRRAFMANRQPQMRLA